MTFDELLDSLLGPTGIPDRLRAANSMFNPVEGVGQSMQASRTLFAPETSGMGRVEAAGNMLSGMASVAAPAIAASRAGVPAANALAETLTGVQMGAQDVGRAVVARLNQPGELGALGSNGGNLARAVRSAPQTPAQEVAALLAAGRGAEVTDDLMARVDPQEMWRLYESGATGMDMPMDAASRMGRAKGIGFDTDLPLYHGTGADFPAFSSNPAHRFSEGSGGPQAKAAWLTEGRQEAARYAGNEMTAESGAGFPTIISARIRPGAETVVESRYDVPAALRGSDTVNVRQDFYSEIAGEPQHWRVVSDPRNIRSTFARFDPRLRHLANLSAAGASVAVSNALAPDQNRHPYD